MSIFRVIRSFIICGLCLVAVLAEAQAAHKVKKGDTLFSIARANGVSVASLKSANGIKDVNRLQIGKSLVIPSKSKGRAVKVGLKATTVTRAKTTKSKILIVDPGHGGRDKGAVHGGVRESDLNLKTAFKLEYYAKRAGYKVIMTRRSDRYVSLRSRAAIANRYPNAVFISIHYNATPEKWVHGGETFHSGSGSSRYLASSLQRYLISNCKLHSRKVRYGNFSVLHNTSCPAALIECGFISNSRERARCNTSSFQDAAARAILFGLERWDRSY